MKFLGIDYGKKRIGVATSDEGGTLAFPKKILQNDEKAFDSLREIIKEENIGEIVIGESSDFQGKQNPISEEIEKFTRELEKKFKVPVQKEKEFLTSVEARRYEGGGHVDASAAALILQRYLDKKNIEE